jgi:hypothetical protein
VAAAGFGDGRVVEQPQVAAQPDEAGTQRKRATSSTSGQP